MHYVKNFIYILIILFTIYRAGDFYKRNWSQKQMASQKIIEELGQMDKDEITQDFQKVMRQDSSYHIKFSQLYRSFQINPSTEEWEDDLSPKIEQGDLSSFRLIGDLLAGKVLEHESEETALLIPLLYKWPNKIEAADLLRENLMIRLENSSNETQDWQLVETCLLMIGKLDPESIHNQDLFDHLKTQTLQDESLEERISEWSRMLKLQKISDVEEHN